MGELMIPNPLFFSLQGRWWIITTHALPSDLPTPRSSDMILWKDIVFRVILEEMKNLICSRWRRFNEMLSFLWLTHQNYHHLSAEITPICSQLSFFFELRIDCVMLNAIRYLMLSSMVVAGHLVMMAKREEQVLRHW